MAVDHEKRRRHIAGIAIDLIAREGLEAATIRRLAAEASCSTAAITHYFADKQALLLSTFQILAAEGDARFEEALRGDPADITGALLTMLPWCPANARRWKAYLAFWDQAARDPKLASLLAGSTKTGLAYIEGVLRPGIEDPIRLTSAARLLNAQIQGLSLQILVEPEDWPAERVRVALAEALLFVNKK